MEEFFKDLAKGNNKLTLSKVLYALIIFLGAFLAFMFQPVTGKILTPQYGGGADIWTSCLVFFQFILFGGYLIAYFLNKLKPKVCATIYAILFILALILFKMPTEFGSWLIFEKVNPLISLFASLFKYAALPVLVLSTVSVSMQNWYTRQTGESPYILYSISNIGSFLALFLYPLIYEPIMPTSSVIGLWRGGFILLVLLIILASFLYFKSPDKEEEKEQTDEKISIKSFLYWIALSAAGYILLASYTTFATVAILPMPLIWTLFLGVYLLTFVLCFGSEKFYKRNVILISIPVFAVINWLCGNTEYAASLHPVFSMFILALMFFAFLMLINGEIYKTRPHPSKLSEFYLSIAFGGVLGGLFVNIIAPLIFNDYTELPLINVIMYIFALYIATYEIIKVKPLRVISYLKLGAFLAVTILLMFLYYPSGLKLKKISVIESQRNFYGVARVTTYKTKDMRVLSHGSTLHGAQIYNLKENVFVPVPLTYYTNASALAYAVEGMRNYQNGKNEPLNIGVIGLGTGTAASYTEKNDKMTFYEIDPKIYDIAKNKFSYLKDAKGSVDIVLGDARIMLDKEAGRSYDILLVDAFSSDSVPVHLITKEAFDIYKKHIKNDGIILFHISNRYLMLDRVFRKLADKEGLQYALISTVFRLHKEHETSDIYKSASKYFVIFMPENKLYKNFKNYVYGFKGKGVDTFVQSIETVDDKFLKLFTDDYSSLVRIFSIWDIPEDDSKDIKK